MQKVRNFSFICYFFQSPWSTSEGDQLNVVRAKSLRDHKTDKASFLPLLATAIKSQYKTKDQHSDTLCRHIFPKFFKDSLTCFGQRKILKKAFGEGGSSKNMINKWQFQICQFVFIKHFSKTAFWNFLTVEDKSISLFVLVLHWRP